MEGSRELTIGIPVYNGKDILQQCLNSIIRYTENVDYEILVFDNASEENVLDIIEEKYPDVKTIQNKENIGYAGALNKIFSAAKGRYIAFLNSDITIKDNVFKRIIQFMEENPDVGLASPILHQPGQGIKRNFGIIFPNIFTIFLDYTGISRFIPLPFPKHPAQVSYIEGTFMVMHRRLMEKYGPFDENFFLFMEDLDFQLRIRGKEKVFILPDIVVDHLWGGSLPHHHPITQRIRIKSLCYYFKKHRPKWECDLLKMLLLFKRKPWIKGIIK